MSRQPKPKKTRKTIIKQFRGKRAGLRNTAPKITEESALWIENHFKTLNTGMTWMSENFPGFYDGTLAEMKGCFEPEEALLILESMKGSETVVSYGPPGMSGQYLAVNIQSKGEDVGGILDKLSVLTRFQLSILELWACCYWMKEPCPMEEYLRQLV